jgi:TAG lipase/steryl ester hydrolase/phospholipase A2/LPA acyltransferase
VVAMSQDTSSGTIDISPRRRMRQATSYEEWKQAAIAQDERTGAAEWKTEERIRRYDYQVIRARLDEIREVRASGNPHRILFFLNEGIHGNTGAIGASSLYRVSHFGTKNLITHYSKELAGALDDVANAGPQGSPAC